MALYIWPPESVSVSVPPLEILVDGVPTTVDFDTTTPATSVAVPVYITGSVAGAVVDYGASNVAQRTAAQIGNTTGQADFNAGNASAQTLRTVIATDQSALPVTGPLTDVQLRATAVPVSGPLTDTQLRATAVPVSGPLTDAQLRATAVPVSMAASPLPTGAATEAKQDVGNASLADIDTQTTDIPNVIAPEGGAQPTKGVVVMGHTGAGVVRHILVENSGRQIVNVTASVLPTGAATEAKQDTGNTSLASIDGKVLTDAQLRASAVPVSLAAAPLPTGAATEAKQDTGNTSLNNIDLDLGGLTDTAVTNPASSASVIAALKGLLTLIAAQTLEINKSVANGATQSNSTVSTTAANVAIPANTVGFIIQGFTGNAGLYWSLGGTAANDGSSGHKLEDSRDSGYIPYGGTGNLSVIGEAASTRYQITWFTRS
jgi:hypothetical protein